MTKPQSSSYYSDIDSETGVVYLNDLTQRLLQNFVSIMRELPQEKRQKMIAYIADEKEHFSPLHVSAHIFEELTGNDIYSGFQMSCLYSDVIQDTPLSQETFVQLATQYPFQHLTDKNQESFFHTLHESITALHYIKQNDFADIVHCINEPDSSAETFYKQQGINDKWAYYCYCTTHPNTVENVQKGANYLEDIEQILTHPLPFSEQTNPPYGTIKAPLPTPRIVRVSPSQKEYAYIRFTHVHQKG